ncbi:hypothetical protein NHF39_00865 [Pseudomonas proteolytica]|nr:hypothetical protein [Pseudomonas proteolytica]USW95372.1 hypothetical protein NHF39_00865 [Pseudomonas proteolytica]USX00558.1 hypothetical protein NHF41_01110 [Pseudomonas proteolytica]
MSASVFEKLKLHPRPVNRAAVAVGFLKGEHFEARFDKVRPKMRITLDHPPQTPLRPERATDYTGKKRGRMTAYAWHRPSLAGNGTWWICRCDCGLYEYRRPGTWASKPLPGDMCEVCLRSQEMMSGPTSKQRTLERLASWIRRMRELGLSDLEITQLRAPGVDIDTAGKTAAEIRKQIANGSTL